MCCADGGLWRRRINCRSGEGGEAELTWGAGHFSCQARGDRWRRTGRVSTERGGAGGSARSNPSAGLLTAPSLSTFQSWQPKLCAAAVWWRPPFICCHWEATRSSAASPISQPPRTPDPPLIWLVRLFASASNSSSCSDEIGSVGAERQTADASHRAICSFLHLLSPERTRRCSGCLLARVHFSFLLCAVRRSTTRAKESVPSLLCSLSPKPSTFSCQSRRRASTHHTVIGADGKKTLTPVLM